jgi:hypothetical protein
VVGEDGNVYEGRGWDNWGAHAPAYNSKSIGICIIGDFTGGPAAMFKFNTNILEFQHRPSLSENRELRKIFGPKREKIAGEWRRQHSEEFHGFYS